MNNHKRSLEPVKRSQFSIPPGTTAKPKHIMDLSKDQVSDQDSLKAYKEVSHANQSAHPIQLLNKRASNISVAS
jgi:hypothetical protein